MSSYVLKIKGKRSDYFVSLLIHLHIYFKKIFQTKDEIILEVLEEDYEKIMKLKTSYQITIIKRKGLAYILYQLKTKKLFLVFLFCGFFLLIFLSNIIFKVEVIETDQHLRQQILEDLKELGISKYHLKVTYQQKEKIRKQILEKEKKQLEWLEIEEIGTYYQVKLIKRVEQHQQPTSSPRHLVAKKSGMIVEIKSSTGEVVTKKNQYVQKGDILISGIIKNKDKITASVAAKGKVYAEIWYKVSMNLPKTFKEEKRTGKSKQVLELDFLTNDIALNDFFPYKHEHNTKKVLWKHWLLPFQINITKKEEVTISSVNYSKDKSLQKVSALAIEKLKNKLGSSIEIISEKVLKKEQSTATIKVDLFFKVKEDITDYRDIQKEELNQSEQ